MTDNDQEFNSSLTDSKIIDSYSSLTTQLIYTEIQRHAVWTNMSFWGMSFYSDV